MTITLEQSAHDVSEWFLQTVLTALEDCGREPISRAYVAAGQIAWDDCCGMLVVAPERVYRSVIFPTENANEDECFGGYLTIDLLVLLVRCVPTVDDRGRAPSAASLQSAYQRIIEDAAVVMNAVTTDLPDTWVRAAPNQTFVGADGGCIGVETRFTIGFEQSEWAICCAQPEPHLPGDPICLIPAQYVSFAPCEGLTSINIQDALCELAAQVNTLGQPTSFTVNGGTIGGTQPTFSGPPLFTGQYVRIGDLVHFEIQVDFDNITSFGTGQYFLDLPFPTAQPIMFRNGCLHDDDTGLEYHISGHANISSVTMELFTTDRQGNRIYDFPFTSTEPVTLTTADNFHIAGDYIAEPLP